MNEERINELIEQCIDQRWTVTGPMFDKEKFAQLIVRECLGIIDEEGSHEGGSIRSMEAIKEHFGVEE